MHQHGGHPLLVVIVIAGEGRLNPVMLQENPACACILRSDEVDLAEDVEGAQADIAEMADRRADQVECAGLHLHGPLRFMR